MDFVVNKSLETLKNSMKMILKNSFIEILYASWLQSVEIALFVTVYANTVQNVVTGHFSIMHPHLI